MGSLGLPRVLLPWDLLGSQGFSSHGIPWAPKGSPPMGSLGLLRVPLTWDPLGFQGSPHMGSLGAQGFPSHGIPCAPKGSAPMRSLGLPRVPSHGIHWAPKGPLSWDPLGLMMHPECILKGSVMLKHYACYQKIVFGNSFPDSPDSSGSSRSCPSTPRRDLPSPRARGQDDVSSKQTPSKERNQITNNLLY